MEPREFLDILHVAERLKDTPRHCTTSRRRTESVAEHSWRVSLMAFLLRDEFPDLDTDRVDVLFRPVRNEFNGRVTPQLQLQAIRPAEAETGEREDPEGFFLACLQEMSQLSAKQREHIPEAPGLRPEHLLKERLRRVDTSREALLAVYAELVRDPGTGPEDLAEKTGVSTEQILFALTAFAQLGLIRWRREPYGVEVLPRGSRKDLEQSPAVRYLREMGRA